MYTKHWCTNFINQTLHKNRSRPQHNINVWY
jgi:hypothetical protein